MYDTNSKEWTKLPISEHNFPQDGYVCYCNKFWIVTEDNCVLKFQNIIYQCNLNEEISKTYAEKYFLNCTSKFFEVLYFPQADRYANY